MSHPLENLIVAYVKEFDDLKDSHADLDPYSFQKKYSLQIHVPPSWPVYESIVSAIREGKFSNVVVIFSSTENYKTALQKIEKGIENIEVKIDYFSWYEMYHAMATASENSLNFKRLKDLLFYAECVFFLDYSTAQPDVVNQVKRSCESCCLICLE